MSHPRLRAAGDSALLLELDAIIDIKINARATAIAATFRNYGLAGVRDVVSTYRSVAVYFDPLVADIDVVSAALERAADDPSAPGSGRSFTVPVVYGGDAGPDLAAVAAFAGLTLSEVIERHTNAVYRVFMLGFLPGFAYLGTVDERIAAPRRATPRVRVPAGAVGIAGRQTGVYPLESPGGWQIIGRTALPIFDPDRVPPSLFAPGDSVRFVSAVDAAEVSVEAGVSGSKRTTADPDLGVRSGHARPEQRDIQRESIPSDDLRSRRHVTVLRPGLFTTIQDNGRWGHQASGVPVSGALDIVSHRVANAILGNDPDAATLEVTLRGPELRVDHGALVAVAGADLDVTVDEIAIPLNRAVECRPGSIVRCGERRRGTRAYIAFNGGVAVPPLLGSRATHVLTSLGGIEGRRIAAHDRLPLGDARELVIASGAGVPPIVSGGAQLRVLPGPQQDYFPEAAFDVLQRSRFVVATQSDRMGYRLTGNRIPRLEGREMISDATFAGAIQVPSSGDPILLLADRQTTGGYPQLATVITADLPLAGQLAPGDWIEFRVCSRDEALAALAAQDAAVRAIR